MTDLHPDHMRLLELAQAAFQAPDAPETVRAELKGNNND